MKALVLAISLLLPASATAAVKGYEELKSLCVENINATIANIGPESIYSGNQKPVCDCVADNLYASEGEKIYWLHKQLDAYYNFKSSEVVPEVKSLYMLAVSECTKSVLGEDKVKEESMRIKGEYKPR